LKSLACFLMTIAVAANLTAQVTNEDLRKGPGQNWLTYIGDYFAQRHSPLTQINRDTVARLAPKWVRHFDTQGDLETTPLVYDGVMYATQSNEVFALDAVTGREVWRYRAAGARAGRRIGERPSSASASIS
jgi:Glucose dehydrogenase